MRTTVTPANAANWLQRNNINRPVKRRQVAKYARDMANGDWQYTGDAIKFAPDGELVDGQHRLMAVVLSNVPIDTEVLYDIPREAQDVMDAGAGRTASDMLALRGMSHATTVGAAAKLGLGVEMGAERPGSVFVTHPEIRHWIEKHPGIHDSAALAVHLQRRADCPGSVLAYTHLVLSDIDSDQATQFWVDVADKVNLPYRDPALSLANRFAEQRRNRAQTQKHVYLSLIYRAWNARREGRIIAQIRTHHNGHVIPVPTPK